MKKILYIGAVGCFGVLLGFLIMAGKEQKHRLFLPAAEQEKTTAAFAGISIRGLAEAAGLFERAEQASASVLEHSALTEDAKKESLPEEDRALQVLSAAEIQKMPAGTILNYELLKEDIISELFYESKISEEIYQRINGISWQENERIGLEELRYLRVLHWGFDGETHIGELIVNVRIAEDVLEIMEELYSRQYPIEKMLLIDEYGGSDEASMEDNNTSAFNYRTIAGTDQLSNHSLGLALDINPRYNPYVKEREGILAVSPENGADFADRSREFPYKIDGEDLCLRLFLEHGFTWGGNWSSIKDYQHFEKE